MTLPQRADALVARPPQDRDSRDRRKRCGDRLETAHGAGAGRVRVGEPEPPLRVGVEVRRPVLVRAVQVAELSAERFARHDDDVELAEAIGSGRMSAAHLAQRELRELRAVGHEFRLAAGAGCQPASRSRSTPRSRCRWCAPRGRSCCGRSAAARFRRGSTTSTARWSDRAQPQGPARRHRARTPRAARGTGRRRRTRA